MAAFRTDFNYLDQDTLEKTNLFSTGFSTWNLYHLTFGATWVFQDKLGITMAFEYVYGRNPSDVMRTNLTEPSLENNLYGPDGLPTTANYYNLNISIGITYIFVSE